MHLNHALAVLSLVAASSFGATYGGVPGKEPAQDSTADVTTSLELLKERATYAALDKQAVETLAREAASLWPQEFSNFEYKRVERFSAGGAAHWISIWVHTSTGLEFALVPGGTFQMGSPTSETERKQDEPQHWVTLDPFLIARTECTQRAWAKFANAASLDGEVFVGSPRLPKVGMFPEHVDTWCEETRLMIPTEAQWEFMCRAGTETAWTMGADKTALKHFANLGSAECPDQWTQMPGITEAWHDGYGAMAAPVAQFATNAFGLFDVHGNIREWCRDQYFSYETPVEFGTGMRAGVSGERMARGGDFGSDAGNSRSALRFKCGAGISPEANNGFGFRPSLDLPLPVSLEGWPAETFALPPSFAPEFPTGTESLLFAPGWRKPGTDEFWSYAFVMSIDEAAPDAGRIIELLNGYYDGLMLTFARNAGKDIGSDPAQFETVYSTANHLEAKMHVTDAFATFEPIDVRVLVDVVAESPERTRLRVQLSPQPKEHQIWRALAAAALSLEEYRKIEEAPALGQLVTEIDSRIWVLHQARNGDYWFGSNGAGVYRHDGERITRYTKTDGLSGDQVRGIEEDKQGNVLISTNDGISKFDGKKFATLEVIEATSDKTGWELNPGDHWMVFQPGSHGPYRYDGEKLYHLKLSKSPAEDAFRTKYPDATYSPMGVYSVYQDRRGHVWFGTASVGLCRYDGQTLSWMYEERLTTAPSGGAFGIRSIFEDRAGDFWICNTRQRFKISPEVTVEDGYSLIQYEKKEGLPDAQSDTSENFNYFPSMTEDAAGALWMACGNDGVWKYDGKDVTRYEVAGGAYVLRVFFDQRGKLWVGTLEHGLHVFNGVSLEPISLGESDL